MHRIFRILGGIMFYIAYNKCHNFLRSIKFYR